MIILADLKAWLGVTEAGDDALLTKLEQRAVAFVQRRTGRYFGPPASTTLHLCGSGSRTLRLPEAPTDGPTEVLQRPWPGADEVVITDDDDDGFVVRSLTEPEDRNSGTLVRKGGYIWPRGYDLEVTFSRGYTAGNEPGEIRQLVLDLCALKYGALGAEGLKSETMGGYSYTAFGEQDLVSIPGAMDVIALWSRLVYA